jgi:hypothetical protein
MFLTKTFIAGNERYEPFPFLGELIMEAFLVENPKALNLGTAEFEEARILGHEIHLENGSNGKDGRIDILAAYDNRIAIIELKKGQVGEKVIREQLCRYLEAREKLAHLKLEGITDDNKVTTLAEAFGGGDSNNIEWIGILAGTSIEPKLACRMREGMVNNDEDQIPIGAVTINRFKGEKNRIYTITDTYFPEKINGRDYTKYDIKLKGNIIQTSLPKNRLALEIVKLYVLQNKPQTGIELEKEFHKSLQGTITVMPEEEAKDGRSFKKRGEKILLPNGDVYCVSNQWGKDNIKRMIARAKDLMSDISIEANS